MTDPQAADCNHSFPDPYPQPPTPPGGCRHCGTTYQNAKAHMAPPVATWKDEDTQEEPDPEQIRAFWIALAQPSEPGSSTP